MQGYLSIEQVASILGISESGVRKLCGSPHVKKHDRQTGDKVLLYHRNTVTLAMQAQEDYPLHTDVMTAS